MAARGTRAFSSIDGQISEIRDKLQNLLPERTAPSLAGAADIEADPIQKLLGYAKLAAEVFPQLRQFVRGNRATPPAARAYAAQSRAGLLRRYPVVTGTLAVGLAFGVGLVAYALMGGQRPRRWRAAR